ncbi:MAG: hypothetical protein WCS21_10800 [Lachnospiraceae bacterium]
MTHDEQRSQTAIISRHFRCQGNEIVEIQSSSDAPDSQAGRK